MILPVGFENFHYLPMLQDLRPELPELRHVIAVREKNDSPPVILTTEVATSVGEVGSAEPKNLHSGGETLRSAQGDIRDVDDSVSDVLYLDELMARASGKLVPKADIDPAQDLAFLMYTSGTT